MMQLKLTLYKPFCSAFYSFFIRCRGKIKYLFKFLRTVNLNQGTIMPGTPAYVAENKGEHIIYTGGKYASYLQLAVKPV